MWKQVLVTIGGNFACIGNLTGSDIGTWYQCSYT